VRRFFLIRWSDFAQCWYVFQVTTTAESAYAIGGRVAHIGKCKRWSAPGVEFRTAGPHGEVRVDAARLVWTAADPDLITFTNEPFGVARMAA
jgi:hypothetical protein